MLQPQEQPSHSESISPETPIPNQDLDPSSILALTHTNPHLAFQKNYPKNIFIPLIEHLNQLGLRKEYEACVGTRESFQGKNVVSLAEIYRVMSQGWFAQGINLPALISNMSNKILMNSKIKKKLFHLLLVRELFVIPLQDPRQFKKIVSRRASEVAQSKLPTDALFQYPSALIYLLSLFASGLSGTQKPQGRQEEEQSKKYPKSEDNSQQLEPKKGIKQISSKQQYKHHISKIVAFINTYQGQQGQLLHLISAIKIRIQKRQQEVRSKYGFAPRVPEWSYFNTIVVDSCYQHKRSKNKLTFSMLNSWIQDFKEKATSLNGFLGLMESQPETYRFAPIVLISPPL